MTIKNIFVIRNAILFVLFIGISVCLSFSAFDESHGCAHGQDKFTDKLLPRSEDWSVNCWILSLSEKTVEVLFPGQDKPVQIQRASLEKVEYESGRQIIFNRFGQIEGEIIIPEPVRIKKVRNLGLLQLTDGREVVLNGIDFTLPADSLELHYFHQGGEHIRSLAQNSIVQLQFDIRQRDEFCRLLVYVILPDGLMLNAELIKRGYCRIDRERTLIYLDDFIALEAEAKREKRGIWNKNHN